MKLHTFLAIPAPLLASCVSLDYDLTEVALPISAKPEPEGGGEVLPFRIERKNVLWIHGLAGQSEPDVSELVNEAAAGYDRIAGFRGSQVSSGHGWFITHLSLTLVRMKGVVIEGQLVRDRP